MTGVRGIERGKRQNKETLINVVKKAILRSKAEEVNP
jgi:hypothetical protein